MKIVEENVVKNEAKDEKLFTKNLKNNIMSKKYNPSNKDKCFYERKELFMKSKEIDSILKSLKKEKKIDEEVLRCCYNICKYYKKIVV